MSPSSVYFVYMQAKQAEERRQKERQEREQAPYVIPSTGQGDQAVYKTGGLSSTVKGALIVFNSGS